MRKFFGGLWKFTCKVGSSAAGYAKGVAGLGWGVVVSGAEAMGEVWEGVKLSWKTKSKVRVILAMPFILVGALVGASVFVAGAVLVWSIGFILLPVLAYAVIRLLAISLLTVVAGVATIIVALMTVLGIAAVFTRVGSLIVGTTKMVRAKATVAPAKVETVDTDDGALHLPAGTSVAGA